MTFMKMRSAAAVKKVAAKVDWEERPDTTCVCRVCQSQFISPSKFVFSHLSSYVSRFPCPSCGGHELSAAYKVLPG